jgi:hypothetical protein
MVSAAAVSTQVASSRRREATSEAGRRVAARNGRMPERTVLTGACPLLARRPRVGDRALEDLGRERFTMIGLLVERQGKLRQQTLRYLCDFRVPFDNNLAERDIRMMRVYQKVSGSFRSYEGALAFCKMLSSISTIRKQGLSVIDTIMNTFEKDLPLHDCLPTT